MARKFSKNAAVHRELDSRLGNGPQLGEDVGKVTQATRNRLGARGYPESAKPKRSTTWTKENSDRAAEALYALGAMPETVKAARAGRLTIGAQRMLRFPGKRSQSQLGRAADRRDEVKRRVKNAKADKPYVPGSEVVKGQRRRAARAAQFALDRSGRNYTQGPSRWNPINGKANPVTNKMWSYADCSSFATWVVWHAVGRGGADIVNGQDWQAGYTGTMLNHGRRVTSGQYLPGDCAIYGGGTGAHVVVCVKSGTASTARWASHGSQGGPYEVGLHYRGDLNQVRRYFGL